MAGVEYYHDVARRLVAGKKVILPGGVLANAGPRAAALRELGADRPFLLAASEGTGEQPTPDQAESFSFGIRANSIIEEIRETDRLLSALPDAAVTALDAYDPAHEAIVLGSPLISGASIAGRRVLGLRPAEWTALEDKVVVDELWDAADVSRASYDVVPADAAALVGAARNIDRGDGTVWAGDATEGFNGGADYARWVRRADDIDEAASFFAQHCESVRVMPFLEGIPTSIHGFIQRGHVAVFRPVELLTLRTATNRFRYAGTATYWDPSPDDRDQMRAIAQRVGAELWRRVAYRGGFTVDGVLTTDGFRPTELNARFGAGMVPLLGSLPFPLGLIQTIAIEDESVDLRPAELERMIVDHADANRGGRCYTMIEQSRTKTLSHPVIDGADGFALAADGEEASGTLQIGPAAAGGLVGYQPDPPKVPVGASFAPTAVRVYAFADAHFSTGIGPLEAPRPVR